jgi:hypothetical protein
MLCTYNTKEKEENNGTEEPPKHYVTSVKQGIPSKCPVMTCNQ